MASRPAKRQRKLLLSSEDDEQLENDHPPPRRASISRKSAAAKKISPSKPRVRKTTNTSSKGKTTSVDSSPVVSPAKRKQYAKASKEHVQSSSLHTFFKPATEDERWNRADSRTTANAATEDNIEDQIEDDSTEEASNATTIQSQRLFPLDRRKTHSSSASVSEGLKQSSAPTNNGERFAKDVELAQGLSFPSKSYRTWAERFPPDNLDEIAIHKKKLVDVQQCLVDMLEGRTSQKLLVLKGPAGTGKSTLISVLSRALKFSIVEWRNPASSEGGKFTSIASQLEDFLYRGGQFGDLSTDVSEASTSTSQMTSELFTKRVLMIEEFPSSISGNSSGLRAFRNSLLRYLSSTYSAASQLFNVRSKATAYPAVVMVVSEALLSLSIASSEAFTAHRLLGPDLISHPAVRIVEFNPTALTFVTKALDLTLRKEARCSKRRRIPGSAVIKRLAECGDIRSAINSLEFMCLRREERDAWSGRVAAKVKRSGTNGVTLTDMEKESLELLTQREATLGMFHAVGKVVYNKRESIALGVESQTQPPSHLEHHARPLKSQTSVDELMDETGTDIQTFIATLHENYVLSCKSPSFVNVFADCAEQVSDADMLNADSSRTTRRFGGPQSRNSVIDAIRQSEIGFQVAVRGLLFALPCPVSRAEHPRGRKNDRFKMYFPTSLRLWKPSEENESVLDRWFNRLLGGEMMTESEPLTAGGGVAAWKSWSRGLEKPLLSAEEDNEPEIRILASKNDILLERLPYLKHQNIRNRHARQDLDRMTTFAGLRLRDEETSDEEDSRLGNSPSNELASEMLSLEKAGKWREQELVKDVERKLREDTKERMEKLYISDDDIED